MAPWLEKLVESLGPSIVLAFVTAWITVQLSLRRFRGEKWWERKADAYSRIVEALNSMMEYWSAQSDQEVSGKDINEDHEKRLSDNYDHAERELSKATGIGAYIISDKVAEALAKLQKRPRLNMRECSWYEICYSEHTAYLKTLKEVRQLAKKDLRVRWIDQVW